MADVRGRADNEQEAERTMAATSPASEQAARGGIGSPVRRKEDFRLLKGEGRFSDDVNLPGQAYAAFVRSPHAHARIVRIDCSRALRIPRMLLVLTGKEMHEDGLNPIPHVPKSTHKA